MNLDIESRALLDFKSSINKHQVRLYTCSYCLVPKGHDADILLGFDKAVCQGGPIGHLDGQCLHYPKLNKLVWCQMLRRPCLQHRKSFNTRRRYSIENHQSASVETVELGQFHSVQAFHLWHNEPTCRRYVPSCTSGTHAWLTAVCMR